MECPINLATCDTYCNEKQVFPAMRFFIEEMDKILLRKRSLIETVNDQLKNISQIEHSRHRSLTGFMVNVVCALIAYTWQPKKPSLNIRGNDMKGMVVVNNTAHSTTVAV